ncbi:hypothetical protein [Micromonospora sp. WMMD708]|uniref:hypothetical protein n=1 Tax=Micromonospora sp. WMMD708 TaxID=3403464 RepID=UPI003BF56F80
MGEQALTPAGADADPAGTPADRSQEGPGAATAGMTADGRTAAPAAVPGAGMTADAGGTGGPRELTADLVAGPGGVMTDEVGVVTGELTLKSRYADGQVALTVQYKDADEWYAVTGGTAKLADPADLDAVHTVALALLHRPEG